MTWPIEPGADAEVIVALDASDPRADDVVVADPVANVAPLSTGRKMFKTCGRKLFRLGNADPSKMRSFRVGDDPPISTSSVSNPAPLSSLLQTLKKPARRRPLTTT